MATVASPTGTVDITELAELREVLQSTGLNTTDENFGDTVGFAVAWVERFPVVA